MEGEVPGAGDNPVGALAAGDCDDGDVEGEVPGDGDSPFGG